MKIIGKIQTFSKMMPVIEKDQMPDRNEVRRKRDQKLPDLNKLTNKNSFVCTTDPKDIKSAEKNYRKTNRVYKNRCKKEGEKVVIELRERYPCFWFTNERWIERADKKKPVKNGKKLGDTRISRELITSLVDALMEKGFSKNMAFEILEENLLVEHRWLSRLYDDTQKGLLNQSFTVSSIPKSIDEHDRMLYEFLSIKPGVKIGS